MSPALISSVHTSRRISCLRGDAIALSGCMDYSIVITKMICQEPNRKPASAMLRKTLGLRDLVYIVIGTVIGSGIFLTPGTAAKYAGSGGMALIVWTVGGILSLLGALTFAELAASRPESGGLYVYIRDAFGPGLAFLYGWTMFLVIGSGSLATLGAAFPRYVGVFVPLTPVLERIVSLAMIAVVALLNIRGTRRSADVKGVATAIKVAVIVGLALALVTVGRRSHPGDVWWTGMPSASQLVGATTAMISVLWAYEGWQYVTFSAGRR